MIKIYYVEDDENIANTVKEYLSEKGYQTTVFSTIKEAKAELQKALPSLVLVDWNMPDGSGNSLCKWLRARHADLPIIFLTVRGEASDIVSGFQNGADDYVVKPFELEVLLSRISAILRRVGDISKKYLSCQEIALDKEKHMAFYRSRELSLTPAEYQLLEILLTNKGRTVTREQLLRYIWDSNGNYVNDNTLTVTMKRLREKLHHTECIKTIRSVGYRLEE
ncbi:response regulator transcription factor [Lachnospiraceae bacterium OttesenSCG-928-J05]|nr:response regulator transcription factor [Lachnospiraceae bacterium OttesenSCG-928-J05]